MAESSGPQPPGLISRLIELFVPADQADAIPGDLLEEFHAKVSISGPRLAHRWYRRQVIRTVWHLLALQFRTAPWAILGAVLGGIALLHLATGAVDFAAGVFLAHVTIYPFVAPKIVWLIYAIGIERIVCPLLTGWLAAAFSKGREMAVAVTLSALSASALISWLNFVLWHRPASFVWLHTYDFYAHSMLLLLPPPMFLFLGAVICRTRNSPLRRHLAH